jgi:hypothetical protein
MEKVLNYQKIFRKAGAHDVRLLFSESLFPNGPTAIPLLPIITAFVITSPVDCF